MKNFILNEKEAKKFQLKSRGSTRYGFKSRYVRWRDQMISRWLAQAYRPKKFKLEVEKKLLNNFKPEPSMQDQNLGVVARFARSIPLFQRKKAYPSGLSLGWGQFKKRPLGSFKNLPPNYPLV